MSTTLYRAYRPQTFSDVIGQDHVVAALTAAIRKQAVGQAYLFTGSRGTGKTTIGRLLAKAVNCADQKEGQPICDACPACTSITAGTNLDVIEIDAASNRGIDDIRLLKERVQFPPQSVKCKVYIIDEVHMLTMEAFNALLKTLEEPPEYALFILATTEVHKVPITIQSRCQRLDFHRGTVEAIVSNLKRVVKAEKIAIDDEALALIAELSEGGFRDSLTLLERVRQLDGKITAQSVRGQLGLGDETLVRELITALVERDRAEVFNLLNRAYEQGANPPYIAQIVVMELRRLLYISVGALNTLDAAEAKLADKLTLSDWRQLLEYWTEAIVASRHSPIPPLALEIAAARWLEGAASVAASPVAPVAVQPAVAVEVEVKKESKPVEVKPVSGDAPTDRVMTAAEWAQVIDKVTPANHSLSKLLQAAQYGPVKNGAVQIKVLYPFHVDTLRQKANTLVVAEALQAVLGGPVVPEFVVADKASQPAEEVLSTINEVFS